MDSLHHQAPELIAKLDIYAIARYCEDTGILNPLDHITREQARAILSSMRIQADNYRKPISDVDDYRQHALIDLLLPTNHSSTVLPSEVIQRLAVLGEYRPDQIPEFATPEIIAEALVALATYGMSPKTHKAPPTTILRQAIRRMDVATHLAGRSPQVQGVYTNWIGINRQFLLKTFRLAHKEHFANLPEASHLKIVTDWLRQDMTLVMTRN